MDDFNDALLAIDYGNSFIKIAYYDPTLLQELFDRAIPLYLNFNGESYLDNTACFMEDWFCIGNGSEDCTKIRGAKKHLGDPDWKWNVPQLPDPSVVDAYDVVKESFSYLYNAAYQATYQNFRSMIATVPVCFTELQRHQMEKAIKEAVPQTDCELQTIITEPFAGLFACRRVFEELKDGERHRVLVFDAGGSTTDMCLLMIEKCGEQYKVDNLAAAGFRFAGDNITDLLYKMLADTINPVLDNQAASGVNAKFSRHPEQMPSVGTDEYDTLFQKYRAEDLGEMMKNLNAYKHTICKNADQPDKKISIESILSIAEETAFNQLAVSYNELADAITAAGVAEMIENAINDMLLQAHLNRNEVDRLVMIGGSSKIPYFRTILQDYLQIPAKEEEDRILTTVSGTLTDFAVALGAVIYLLHKHNRFIIRTTVPYDVGVMGEKGFRCLRRRISWIGEETVKRNVNLETRDDGMRILRMYQRFSNDDNEIYPMGEFVLDPVTFPEDKCLMSLNINEDNRLIGKFFNGNTGEDGITKNLSWTEEA